MVHSNSDYTLLVTVNPLIRLATLKPIKSNRKSSNNQSVAILSVSSVTLGFFPFWACLYLI